jgi:hypothetical protein
MPARDSETADGAQTVTTSIGIVSVSVSLKSKSVGSPESVVSAWHPVSTKPNIIAAMLPAIFVFIQTQFVLHNHRGASLFKANTPGAFLQSQLFCKRLQQRSEKTERKSDFNNKSEN